MFDMENPFVIKGYKGPEYFCDREKETEQLVRYLTNGHDVVLTAPRRIGKTDLISHVFNAPSIKDNFITVKVDIYNTQSFSEFVSCLGEAIAEALKPRGKAIVDKFVEILHSLRSQISFDINGMPVWSLGIGDSISPQTTLKEIFEYLEAAPYPCIVAIDEFQQICKYKDPWKVEATLRTYIQHCKNAQFIYAGSQRHLMSEIFLSPARPFYASSTLMSLPLLDKKTYADFCQRLFSERKKELCDGVAEAVYDKFSGVTAYMHKVMNELYALTPPGGICGPQTIDQAINNYLDVANDGFETLTYQLTDKQKALLLAIAKEGVSKSIQSGAFVKKHKLISASSVVSASKVLLDRDLITRDGDAYSVYDQFYCLWLRRKFRLSGAGVNG